MWETVKDSKKSRKVLLTFFDWMENIVLRSNYFREAEDLFAKFSADISEIDLLSTTPQTPPWHAEGPFVSDHVKRMLATVMAVSGGTSLLQIEEFAVRRDFLSYIETLELTIKENAATLIAFALVHDIAKAEVLSFSADSGSLGEREKFKKNKKYLQNPASTQERLLYDKLFRAHIASRNKEPDSLGLIDFFDKYEISAHYFNHATVGASHKFDDARLAVSNGLHLTSRQGAVVKFLSRYHMDRIKTAEQFNLLIARANKAGLDGFGISDIFVAQEFLDSCCGCLHYIDAHFSIDLSVVFDFFEAERLAVPKLYKIRDQKQKLKEARILKDALTKARLDGESVFKLLDIPFGPKRKDIMRQVRDLVIDKSFKVDFGSSTEEIERRADLARDFLTH